MDNYFKTERLFSGAQFDVVIPARDSRFRPVGIGHEAEADNLGRIIIAEESFPIRAEVTFEGVPLVDASVSAVQDNKARAP